MNSETTTLPGKSSLHAAADAGRARTHRGLMLLLAGMVTALYLPVAGFDFVNWDDPWYVVHNPLIKSWHPANLFRIFTEMAIKNYAPVTLLSYLVQHTLWGLWPGGYHLTGLLLHAVNAVLVYVLIGRLTNNRFIGWTTAALFAVHPVQIETVAWVASQKGLLSGCFILAALIYRLKPQPTDRDEGFYLLFLVLALLSKAIAIVVPPVVFTYDLLVRRQRPAEAFARQLIPAFFCGCLLLITMSAQTTMFGGVRSHMELSRPHILAVDTVIVWQYVGMLVRPRNLCVLYDPPTTGITGWVLLASAGWLAVAGAVYRCRNGKPLVCLAAVSFLAFLLPVLNLFPITTLMNDRYLYLPSIPFFALAAGGLYRLSQLRLPALESELHKSPWLLNLVKGACGRGFGMPQRMSGNTVASRTQPQAPSQHGLPALEVGPRSRPATACLIVGVMLLLGAFSIETRNHLPVWKDDFALWEHAHRHAGHLTVVQIQRAEAFRRRGEAQRAVALLESALQHSNPDPADRKRILKKLADWGK